MSERQQRFPFFVYVLLVSRFISSFGYIVFLLLAALILSGPPFNYSASQVALSIGAVALVDRGAGLFWSNWVEKINYYRGLLLGFFLSGGGLFLFFFVHHISFWAGTVGLVIFGLGLSLESLCCRLWLARIGKSDTRGMAYGWLHRSFNAGAFLAAIVGFTIPYHDLSSEIIIGSASCFFVSFIIVLIFLSKEHVSSDNSLADSQKVNMFCLDNLYLLKSGIWYILICGVTFYFTFQVHLFPYYMETYEGGIPSWFGYALALSPLLVVALQGKASHHFLQLEKKIRFLGIMAGFGFVFLAFLSFLNSNMIIKIWFFIIFITIGEMLIIPHIDYLLSSEKLTKVRPLVFSMTGIMFSLSRTAAESGGIMAFKYLSDNGFSTMMWWWINLMCIGLICVGGMMVVFFKRLVESRIVLIRLNTKQEGR